MSTEVPRYSRVEILMAPASPDGITMVISGDGDELVRVVCDSYEWRRDYGTSNMPPEVAELRERAAVSWPELERSQPETIEVAGYVPAGGPGADTVDGA